LELGEMSGFMSSVVGVCGGLLAQAPAEDALGLAVLMRHLIAASVFAVMGLVIFGLSVLVLNRCLPFSLRKELEEDQNVAVGVILGGMFIGVAIIIAAAIAG
jgi:putative membrane protein